jgi:hypothetical protein
MPGLLLCAFSSPGAAGWFSGVGAWFDENMIDP